MTIEEPEGVVGASESDFSKYDIEKFDEPVTKSDLYLLLIKLETLVITTRNIAVYAASRDLEQLKEAMARFSIIEQEFSKEAAKLVSSTPDETPK